MGDFEYIEISAIVERMAGVAEWPKQPAGKAERADFITPLSREEAVVMHRRRAFGLTGMLKALFVRF